jgi:hypothetical protein
MITTSPSAAIRMQHLHRDRSIVPEVLGEVHRRRATAAELTVE